MNSLIRLFSVAAIVLLCFNSAAAQRYTTLITGRVVDEKGLPVERALVVLESLTENGVDEYSYNDTVFTGKDGRFRVINISTEKNRTRNLYVSGPFPENAIRTVDLPPWENLSRLNPDLLPRAVKLNENFTTNIGDVKPKVYAGIAEIALVKSGIIGGGGGGEGEPFFETEREWQAIYYVLRDESGEPILTEKISANDSKLKIDVKTGVIRFAVAEGTWTLEFISDLENPASIIARTEPFTVNKTEKNLAIKLTVEKK